MEFKMLAGQREVLQKKINQGKGRRGGGFLQDEKGSIVSWCLSRDQRKWKNSAVGYLRKSVSGLGSIKYKGPEVEYSWCVFGATETCVAGMEEARGRILGETGLCVWVKEIM